MPKVHHGTSKAELQLPGAGRPSLNQSGPKDVEDLDCRCNE
jgi:hypothetical protein